VSDLIFLIAMLVGLPLAVLASRYKEGPRDDRPAEAEPKPADNPLARFTRLHR
jgi:hypothetical protein